MCWQVERGQDSPDHLMPVIVDGKGHLFGSHPARVDPVKLVIANACIRTLHSAQGSQAESDERESFLNVLDFHLYFLLRSVGDGRCKAQTFGVPGVREKIFRSESSFEMGLEALLGFCG